MAVPGVPLVTVLLASVGRAPADATCGAEDPAVWNAYAILAGLSPDQLAGTRFLIDPDGWLRAIQRPGDATVSWTDPSALLARHAQFARSLSARRTLPAVTPITEVDFRTTGVRSLR